MASHDESAPPVPPPNMMYDEGAVPEPRHPLLIAAVAVLATALVLVCLGWTLDVPRRFGIALYTEQCLATVIGLALAAAFLSVSRKGKPQARLDWPDIVCAVLGLASGLWIAVEFPRLTLEVSYRTAEVLTLAGLLILLVCEALRRTTGWGLLGTVLGFFAYALVAEYMPVELRGKPLILEGLISYLAFDPSAMLGQSVEIGVTIIIMFLWMGEVLLRAGGGDFFLDLATAGFGRRRGGPAKMCVIGSAMFGMISGSAVSSVASIGVLTIPLMKRTGYSAKDAAAIESVGATAGQLDPPVMGAAAFLMAEFLEIPYIEVAIAATLPAILYYWGLYCQVDLIAGKQGLKGLSGPLPEVWGVLKDGWHLVLPIGLLLFMMFEWDSDPQVAAIGATVAMLVVGMLRGYRGKRLRLYDVLDSIIATGRSTIDLFMILAASGFVIGVLNATGLAFALTLFLVGIAGKSIFVLLLLAALIGLILGMGMPTTAVYILLATLVAPSLVEAGVMKLAAHMFMLYFGMLSVITPPVAVAAFAAANIAKAGPMEVGWAACRIGWTKFILPFMFVLSPTLLMHGSALKIVVDFISAVIGIYFVTMAITGYYRRPVGWFQRTVLAVSGLLAIVPDFEWGNVPIFYISLAGVAAGVLVVGYEYFVTQRERYQSADDGVALPAIERLDDAR
jgi:TRAP transporter 4TM/12TM fusion protein